MNGASPVAVGLFGGAFEKIILRCSTCFLSFVEGRWNCGPPNGVPHGAKSEIQATAQEKMVVPCGF